MAPGDLRCRSILSAARKVVPKKFRPILRRKYEFCRSRMCEYADPMTANISATEYLRRTVESIALPLARTEWSDYDQNFVAFEPGPQWTDKHYNVQQILARLRPRTVLDIGCNRGWYSQLAARKASASFLSTSTTLPCPNSIVMRSPISFPYCPSSWISSTHSPACGVACEQFPSATKRLKCEMVIALAPVHHLVFKQLASFEQIVQGLSAFADRWLLVEFIDRKDEHISEWVRPHQAWYTSENFIAELKKIYRTVERFRSSLPHRILLLCER